MTFAIALAQRPVSVQKKGKKQRFQQNIRDAAMCQVGTSKIPLFCCDLYARIIWFHAVEPKLDVDNIVKPILDTLIGIVYDDDHRIAQCLTTRIDATLEPNLPDDDVYQEILDELNVLLKGTHPHVLYIEVGKISALKVVFGPIDGGEK